MRLPALDPRTRRPGRTLTGLLLTGALSFQAQPAEPLRWHTDLDRAVTEARSPEGERPLLIVFR